VHVNCTVDDALDELPDDTLRQVVAAGLEAANAHGPSMEPEREGGRQDDENENDHGDGELRLAPGQISFCFSRKSIPFKDQGG
jgi:hypothetical protein